jgi:acyl-CoA thioesterase-2
MTYTREELLAWLELERIDRDIYRGRPSAWPRAMNLYGGLVAAQALMAAASTVPEGRAPHSLHGYFLRAGDSTKPVVFQVDRDRDGRSFSARRVAAIQEGKVIWEMACSFDRPVEGPEYTHDALEGVPAPEESVAVDQDYHPIVDMRVPRQDHRDQKPTMPFDRAWLRIGVRLDDDPLVHACMHTYTSDVTTGFRGVQIDGVPSAGPSIDHALWFHHISRADEWILYDCSPVKIGGQRGLYTGTAHDLTGSLVAILAQEMLLRVPDDGHRLDGQRDNE